MITKSKTTQLDEETQSASVQFPKWLLTRIDADANESRRSRSAQIVFMLEKIYEPLSR